MQALEPGVDIREQRDPDGSLILSVSGAIDERAARVVAQRITDSTSPLWALVLELHGVDAGDEPGLSVLLTAIDRGRAGGCSVSLAAPRGPLLRLFRRAGLEPALPLSTRESAPRVRGRFARIAGRG